MLQKLSVNIFLLGVIKAGSAGISILLIPLLLDLFGSTQQLGIWLTLMSAMSLIQVIDFGAVIALKNKLFACKNKSQIYQQFFTCFLQQSISIAICALMFAILCQFVSLDDYLNLYLNSVDFQSLIFIIALGFLIYFLRSITGLLDAQRLTAVSGLVQFFPMLAICLLVSILTQTHSLWEPADLFVIFLVINVIVFLVCWYLCLKVLLPQSGENFQFCNIRWELDFNGLPFFIIQTCIILLYANNELFIYFGASPEAVTEYFLIFRPFAIFTVLFNIFSIPFWSEIRSSKYKVIEIKLVTIILKLMISLSLFLFVLIIVWLYLDEILFLWVGEAGDIINKEMTNSLAFIAFCIVIQNACSALLNGLGKIIRQAQFMILGTLVKFVFFYVNYDTENVVQQLISATVIGLSVSVLCMVLFSVVVVKHGTTKEKI